MFVIALVLASAAPEFGVDRVDLIAEAPATFVNFDVPNALVAPSPTAVRFVEQVQLVLTLPVDGLYVGASLAAQTLSYETPIDLLPGLFVTVGLQTKLLLPLGGYGGVAWRWSWMRVAFGASAFADASWARPNWNRFTVVPTLGFGIVL